MKVDIKGVIVPDSEAWIYEWLEIPHTSPATVNRALKKANGEDIEVIINSPGGSVFSGSEIYTSIKDYKGESLGKIVGIAASAAGIAAMGVKKLLISPTAQFMLHNASLKTGGDHRVLEHGAEFLKTTDLTISNAYMIKTKMAKEELLELMAKETYLSPQEAKEKGFVDGIMFEDELDAVASIDNGMILPKSVIDKIKNEILSKKQENLKLKELNNSADIEIAKAKLQLQLII